MSRIPMLRLTAAEMAAELERAHELRATNDVKGVFALTWKASRWAESFFALGATFNRLSLTQVDLRDSPSPETWTAVEEAAARMAAALKKLGDEYIDVCDADHRDGRKCTMVIRPGEDFCRSERLHR